MGRVVVTRRERRLISDGQKTTVEFMSDGGKRTTYPIDELTEIVPEPVEETVAMPVSLTAANGAKFLLSGEFSEKIAVSCPDCTEGCETCDGSGELYRAVPVSWTTIKAIYAKAVEHFGEY